MTALEPWLIALPLIISAILVASLIKSARWKGIIGEWVFSWMLRINLDKQYYRTVKNITLRLPDGKTAQIDHIIVSRFGIFVVEVKNYQGWIFGDAYSKEWTQSLSKHKRFRFQNPIHQNHGHVMALSELMEIPLDYFKPVVAFVGGGAIKTELPPHAGYAGKMIRYIREQQSVIIRKEQVPEIVEAIQEWVKSSGVSNREHIENARARIREKRRKKRLQASGIHAEEIASRLCPWCGSDLTLRTAKTGVMSGTQFVGCTQFPRCKYKTDVITQQARAKLR
jgi:restriction system protein